jgi:poly(A) polymerase
MRIEADWLSSPSVRRVMACLEQDGDRAYFVGGSVRNALLGLPVADIDIATDAQPGTVIRRAGRCGLKAVPTGVAHGTVTLVCDHRPFEVTTFRTDVETFGRHATVAFTRSLAEDARRRDLTINALYADVAGEVLDPVGGLPDLRARRVRFVGTPAERIAEDYLRILRFFRFLAWYGDPAAGPDPASLAACTAAAGHLAGLARERIGAETIKLLSAPDPVRAVESMDAGAILGRILPGADPAPLARLVELEATAGEGPRWQRRLAAMGWREDWAEALRLSRADRRTLQATQEAIASGAPAAEAAYRFGRLPAGDAMLIRAARSGAPLPDDLAGAVERGATARFPVRAADLPERGADLGVRLRALEAAWIASGFALDADRLLGRKPRATRED